jgi:ABC-type phosphate transport system substrate-binding protein
VTRSAAPRARRALPFGLVVSAIAALLTLAPRPVEAEADVALAVIVAPTSKVTNISFDELRRVFRGEGGGNGEATPFIALNHPPRSADRVGFDQVVLGMDPIAVGRFWIGRKIRRESGPPRTVASLTTLRRVVEKLPGAIGYLRPGQLSNEVRAIRVDGKLPEDAGYPLHYRP